VVLWWLFGHAGYVCATQVPRRRHVPVTHTCYVHRSSGLMGVVQDMVDHNKTTFIIVKCYRLYIGLHSTLRVDLKRTAY
jgi:hypothetical protein